MRSIDAINSQILSVLEREGRISNTDLATKVSLSPSACLRRVQELERRGVIKGYRAVIDRAVIGEVITIFVTVGLSGQLKQDALDFERAMSVAPVVKECHNITGSVEYLLRVEVQDLATYKEFHSNVLGVLSQVSSMTSHICLGSSKDVRNLV
ncbi:Lrp/AsnC family transcriptional regulator [Hellea balneolensis]|nr:Lrp/AsnC family transcriptional regulator [Hellea balneolensis]